MKITANMLQLRNVGQLAATTVERTTYMGRLDSVVSSDAAYDVTIGGQLLKLNSTHQLEIRRTDISESLQLANDLTEELLDSLEAEAVA